jgi:xanthine phosphoribosyltransferase
MTEAPIARRLTVTWNDFDRECRALAAELRGLQLWKGMIAITRGGLAPACILSYELHIRLIETLCISSYDAETQRELRVLKEVAGDGEGMLVVEDIVDTGNTAKIVRRLCPQAYFVSVFAKPAGKPLVDKFRIEVPQETWIDFPWDGPINLAAKVGD